MIRTSRRLLVCSLLVAFIVSSIVSQAEGIGGPSGFCDKIKPSQLLAQSDAERIVGQPARLSREDSQLKGDVRQCMCAYVGETKDKTSGEDSVVYFSLEQKEENPSAEQAHQVILSTKQANEHDTAILDLKGIGDEAFLLSNDANSHLIMARKGAIIMRLQVKRSASKKSLEETRAFAEKASKRF